MLSTHDVFHPGCINIFTDGSVYHNETTGETIGAPGAICIPPFQNEIFDSEILRDSTNNECEIYSILLGIKRLLQIPGFRNYKINLFSDSQICINGLREWIFNWHNAAKGYTLYSSSRAEVSNQEYFKAIVSMIVNYDIHINFYHQKGHINPYNDKHLEIAVKTFKKSNNIDITKDLASILSSYNDKVDKETKFILLSGLKDFNTKVIKNEPLIYYDISYLDMEKYRHNITQGGYS